MREFILIQRGMAAVHGGPATVCVDPATYDPIDATWEPDAGQPYYDPRSPVPGTLVHADGRREPATLLGLTYQD